MIALKLIFFLFFLIFVFWLQVVEKLENVKQIQVKPSGRAEFSLNMTLRDPNSEINIYKVRNLL